MPIYRITDINLTHVPTVQVSRCFLLKKENESSYVYSCHAHRLPRRYFLKKKDLHDFSTLMWMYTYAIMITLLSRNPYLFLKSFTDRMDWICHVLVYHLIVKYDTNLKGFITLLVWKITIKLKKFNYKNRSCPCVYVIIINIAI